MSSKVPHVLFIATTLGLSLSASAQGLFDNGYPPGTLACMDHVAIPLPAPITADCDLGCRWFTPEERLVFEPKFIGVCSKLRARDLAYLQKLKDNAIKEIAADKIAKDARDFSAIKKALGVSTPN